MTDGGSRPRVVTNATGGVPENRLRRPRQARSEETLQRMLESAEALLDEGTFEAATIQEIVRRAGTSVGAFYNRFADKNALFYVLQTRFQGEVAERFERIADPALYDDLDLAARIRRLVDEVIAFYRERRGLFRAISLYARLAPEPELERRYRSINRRIFERVAEMLLGRRHEIRHPRPRIAVRHGLSMIGAALREQVLFARSGLSPVPVEDDDTLAAELAYAYFVYLHHAPGPDRAGPLRAHGVPRPPTQEHDP